MAESIFAKMGMPEEADPLATLNSHRKALEALFRALGPDHIAHGTLKGRVQEIKQAIKDERAAQERSSR